MDTSLERITRSALPALSLFAVVMPSCIISYDPPARCADGGPNTPVYDGGNPSDGGAGAAADDDPVLDGGRNTFDGSLRGDGGRDAAFGGDDPHIFDGGERYDGGSRDASFGGDDPISLTDGGDAGDGGENFPADASIGAQDAGDGGDSHIFDAGERYDGGSRDASFGGDDPIPLADGGDAGVFDGGQFWDGGNSGSRDGGNSSDGGSLDGGCSIIEIALDNDNDSYWANNSQTSWNSCDNVPLHYIVITPTNQHQIDCDDAASTLYIWASGYANRDQDDYTLDTLELLCTNGTLPATHSALRTTFVDPDDADASNPVLAYRDSDEDGVGDPDSELQPVAWEDHVFPRGYSPTNTDCAFNDNTRWQYRYGAADQDRDTYTLALEILCIGAQLPEDYTGSASASLDCDDTNPEIIPGYARRFTSSCGTNNTGTQELEELCLSDGHWGTPYAVTDCSSDACENKNGYWALDGLGSYGCWFASTGGQSCDTVCTAVEMQCVEDNWNDDSDCSVCSYFFPQSQSCDSHPNEGAPLFNQNTPACFYRADDGQDQNCGKAHNVAGNPRLCDCE